MKINIPQPCPADWEQMRIGAIGRHCEQCEKTVVDFTLMSREEIVLFLMLNQGNAICGRFRKNQLDYYCLEEMITMQQLRKMPPKKAALFLSLACAVLASCQNPASDSAQIPLTNSTEITASAKSNDVFPIDSSATDSTKLNSNQSQINPPKKDSIVEVIEMGMIEMGEVIPEYPVEIIEVPEPPIESDTLPFKQSPYTIVEHMPEFHGGMDSLFAFITKNLVYPNDAKEIESQGKVYAQFVVEANGSISNAKILRGSGMTSIDQAVLDVISKMPDWIPGRNLGKAVPVYYSIPITFR